MNFGDGCSSLDPRVREDIGISSYDNSPPCAFTEKALASVDQFGREIDRQAVRLLLERIRIAVKPSTS